MMDDVIYRQYAINAIGKHEVDRPGFHLNEYEEGFNSGLIIACEEIADLPSAQKKGHWIRKLLFNYCSECAMPSSSSTNFCPECGADMRGEAGGDLSDS